MHYLRTWFGWDLVASIPYDLITLLAKQGDLAAYLRLLRLVRLVRLPRLFKCVHTWGSRGACGLLFLAGLPARVGGCLLSHVAACCCLQLSRAGTACMQTGAAAQPWPARPHPLLPPPLPGTLAAGRTCCPSTRSPCAWPSWAPSSSSLPTPTPASRSVRAAQNWVAPGCPPCCSQCSCRLAPAKPLPAAPRRAAAPACCLQLLVGKVERADNNWLLAEGVYDSSNWVQVSSAGLSAPGAPWETPKMLPAP